MEKEKPRLARLTAILTALQSKTLVTATEIAEKHGVSIRTVYRDIRTLEQSGVPIVTEEGRGYSIMAGYKLPPVMFTEEEANALITAESLIAKNRDQSLINNHKSAITKIRAVMRNGQLEKSELLSERIQIRNNKSNERTSNYLTDLQGAITNYRLAKMEYRSLEGKQSNREIEPFAIFSTNENWILVAYCRKRRDFRAFRLDCIEKLTITSQQFVPHKITLQDYFDNCRENILNNP